MMFSKDFLKRVSNYIRPILVITALFLITPSCGHTGDVSLAERETRGEVQIIAHRGAPTFAPENTLPAIRKAVEIGVHMIEIDIHQTLDGHIVLIHDEDVRKTTDGRGHVREKTLEEIKQLDAGSWFSDEFSGTPVPTLEEVFSVMDDTTRLLIEIKKGSPYYPDIERRVIELVDAHHFRDRVLVKSFEDGVIEFFRKHAPEIPVGKSFAYRIPFLRLIIERGLNTGSVFNYEVDFLHSHRYTTSRGFVEKAHEKGYEIFVWDVHTPERMRKYIDMGVDAIETDYPHVLRDILDAY
jgi:glycerophosphoryl diester phosphodiesterase